MRKQVEGQLTLFQGDFLASRSAPPGSAEAVKMTVTSGQRCCELLKKFGPLGLLVKTLLESSTWHSTRCYLTWKAKGTKQRRLYFQLAPSMPLTDETDVPLWPTVTASDYRGRGPNSRHQGLPEAVKMWPTPTAQDSKGANSMDHLTREGKRNHTDQPANAVKMWPTPTGRCGTGVSQTDTRQGGMDLQTAAVMFPTPTTGAGLCGGSGNFQQLIALKEAGAITEEERRSMAAGNGGQLNPDWVEAMMGFPPGWTKLEPDGQTAPGKPESPESLPESRTGYRG